jgi:GAF domain-containing protein
MAYSSFPNPLLPSNAGPILLAVQRPIDLIVPPDAETLVSRLREAVGSGAYDLENIAGALAEAAHTITNAGGAAVALRRGKTVICVGRSGESAPPLGTPLSAESGISGECLRGSVIIRCDDTLLDGRVDAAVCTELGIRSVVAVPLRGVGQTVGIIEVFSANSASFTDAHVRMLRRLGELAESANRAEIRDKQREQEYEQQEYEQQVVLPVPVLIDPAPLPEAEESWEKHRQQLIAAAAVLFFFAAGWVVSAQFHGQPSVSLPTVQAAPGLPVKDEVAKPSPQHPMIGKKPGHASN